MMAKSIYHLPPRTKMELLHSNIWWSDGVELLKKGFSYSKGLELYRQGIRNVDDVWDEGKKEFLLWEEAQSKFKFKTSDAGDWKGITNKLAEEWKKKLEEDTDATYPGMWLGLYVEGKEDPALVVRCGLEFTPPCFQLHNVSLPIPATCFTVGTYSRCLREWEHPEGEVEGHSHKVKVIHTSRGPKKEGEEGRE